MVKNTNALYILRFIAAVTVVLFHFSPPVVSKKISFLIENGGEAVTFFFFISGFVMIISNTKKYFASETAHFSKADFYVKRFARIYPLYLFALLLQAFFHYGIHPIDTQTVKYRLPFEVLGIQRWFYTGSFNSPGWTISCEFFFYILFPFLIVYMRKSMKRFEIFAACYYILSVSISILLYYISLHHLPPAGKKIIDISYAHPVLLISVFILGMVCGRLFMENKTRLFDNKRNRILSVIFSVAAIYVLKYNLGYFIIPTGILSPLYFFLVLGITSFKTNKKSLFNSRLFIFLGEISFGVYILQAPVFFYYSHFVSKITDAATLIFYLFTLIALASVTYYLIEIPAKRLILDYYHKRTIRLSAKRLLEEEKAGEQINPLL